LDPPPREPDNSRAEWTDLTSVPFVSLIQELLRRLGENPEREGLRRTPERVARSLELLTTGYSRDPKEALGQGIFEVDHTGMVLVKDIEMYSLCEHHVLPFFGRAHVAYIPDGKIIGLSKVARLVDVFARRLQVQERITEEVADALWRTVRPQGVGVVIEAKHLCMMMRGVQKQDSTTVTSAMRGVFLDDFRTRHEFLRLVGGSTASRL